MPPKRAKMSETEIQQHCVKLLNAYGRFDIEWHHVPNGELRNKKTAQRLKSMGVHPGVADLPFIIDAKPVSVELKTATGTQTKDQVEYQEKFERAGGKYYLAKGLEQAIATLIEIKAFRPNIHINVKGLML